MAREPRRGEWLLPLLSEFLGVSGEALRIWNGADADDKWLLVRRAAEYEIRRGPGDEISERTFRQAAATLRAQGDEDGARAMEAASDLANADLDWKHRYDGRPVTTAERMAVDLLASGRIWPEAQGQVTGIDGAACEAASLARDAGGPVPVVIAVGHAGTVEIVSGFGDEKERDAWLADRRHGRAAPADGLPAGPPATLSGVVTGPDCRTRREERILAWFLQCGEPGGDEFRSLEPCAFSTHSRSEIYLAWRQAAEAAGDRAPSAGDVRHELARRMLRAPFWAGRAVGWPFGHHALAYLDRLAATPVTRDQAESAARALLRDDAAEPGRAEHLGTGAAQPGPAGRLVPGTQVRPPWPGYPDDPSPGPVPRT